MTLALLLSLTVVVLRVDSAKQNLDLSVSRCPHGSREGDSCALVGESGRARAAGALIVGIVRIGDGAPVLRPSPALTLQLPGYVDSDGVYRRGGFGRVCVTELADNDDWVTSPLDGDNAQLTNGSLVRAAVLVAGGGAKTGATELSLRPSALAAPSGAAAGIASALLLRAPPW